MTRAGPTVRAVIGAAVVVFPVVSACRRAPPPPPPRSRAVAASTPPSDRLAEGETPPGLERVHDLVLPRGSRIERRFGYSVYAVVPVGSEELANYVRRQSPDAEALIGAQGTVFPKVYVKGAARDHWLRVEINGSPYSSESALIVDRIEDLLPPPRESNEEAMRKAGLTPDGKLLDPLHTD